MKRACRGLLMLWLLAALPSPLAAVDYLFVFHEGGAASVYDAATMELVGSPAVGAGAVHAIGVPDPDDPGRLLEIYVIASAEVVVLDPEPPFAVRNNFPLAAGVNGGKNSAILTPDGRWLLVMTGNRIRVFEPRKGMFPSSSLIEMGGEVTGVTALSNSERAFVSVAESKVLRILSLTTSPPQRIAGPPALPEVPEAIAAAPDGSAVYAAADGMLFALDPRANVLATTIETEAGAPAAVRFDPGAPLDTAFVNAGSSLFLVDLPGQEPGESFEPGGTIREAVTPGQDRIFLLQEENRRFFRATPSSGVLTELLDPRTADPFPLPGVDLEIGPAGQHLFLAFGSVGSVVKLSPDGAFFIDEIIPLAPPTGIAVILAPGVAPSALQIYGGNHQITGQTATLAKPLAVRVLDADGRPVFGAAVTFSSETAGVTFTPAMAATNLSGVAETLVTAPVVSPFQVTAQVGDQSVVFDVNRGAEGQEGISIVSGNYQLTLSNTAYPLPFVVRAVADDVDVSNITLTIDDQLTGVVCPASVVTDENGEASFNCTAPVHAFIRPIEVQVTDSFGRSLSEPFQATSVPNATDLPASLQLLSDRTLTAAAGHTLPDAIRLRSITTNGAPIRNTGIAFTSDGDLTVHPELAVTSSEGTAAADITFGCTLETGTITGTLSATGLLTEEISYTTVAGPAAILVKRQGDLLAGDPGQRLDRPGQTLLAEVTDVCGHPLQREPVEWEVSPPGGAVLESFSRVSSGLGRIQAVVRLGEQPGPVSITARVGNISTTFTLFVNVPVGEMLVVSGNGQVINSGQLAPLPLTVELRDESGAPAPNTGVDFVVTQGTARLTSSRAITNAQGRAFVGIIGESVGEVRVEARSGGRVAVFSLTVLGRMPVVPAAGFVNAGSFAPGWAPGGAGSIFGAGLMEGIEGVVNADVFPFPTELRGVRVLVNGIPAPILALANVNGVEQINIQVPFETPAPSDNVTVTIENNGASAAFSGIQTFRAQPGIFQLPFPEGVFAAALHLDFALVGPSNPARRGETLVLFLTGMGPTNPPVGTNVAGPLPASETVEEPVVTVGGLRANVLGSFYAPGFVTAYQINFVVPPDTLSGNRSVVVTAGGVSSAEALIRVAP